MSDLIDREFIKRLGGECIARRDRETGELIALGGIDMLPSALGTNLAEVGTDTISRRSALEKVRTMQTYKLFEGDDMILVDKAEVQTELMMLPSAQSDIVKDLVTIFQNSKDMKLIARDGDLRADLIVAGRMPSAVPTGKWIKLDMHRGLEQYKCSACNSECYVPECMGEPMYEFCPNCGARMGEEE